MEIDITYQERIRIWLGMRHVIGFERKVLRLLSSSETISDQIARLTNLRHIKDKLK